MAGLRVLVPRGGDLGSKLATAVAVAGGTPTIAPLIEFAEPEDARPLRAALARLAAGEYDWLAVTSATTAEVLAARQAMVPERTRVAAVGTGTRDAMTALGFRADFVPHTDFSASAMVAEWPELAGRVLIPQSAIAEPTLAEGLRNLGLTVNTVTAYETHGLPLDAQVLRLLRGGLFGAVLATSGSTVRAVAEQCTPLPQGTVLACIGESTANAARSAGLTVDVVAEVSTAQELIDALGSYILNPHSAHRSPTQPE